MFADKIKALLNSKGWTPYKLHKVSGVSQSTISDILNNKKSPSGKTLQKFCAALGVSMSEFDENPMDKLRENVIANFDKMDLTEKEKAAAEKIKSMPIDEQQASFLRALEKFKSLSASDQEALIKIINSLPSQK
ncbi:helix-turn-helix transcriptional regulator [Anaerospora hongkongensis]|uniref:helix-turn-helix domain-containing protein n=1 Tax=Anaerospora hongkongensis TaxID=244830 RepID=UPI002FDA240C